LFSAGGETFTMGKICWMQRPVSRILLHGEWIRLKKLVVPEINGSILTKRRQKIIPNANCSTTFSHGFSTLHKKIQIKRVIVSPPIYNRK
jgi:aspartate-semialdehyde dehydrogenase